MTDTFIDDPRRDASAVIRGFVYQVDVTIQRWLELQEHDRTGKTPLEFTTSQTNVPQRNCDC
jgi:hypothetical protein